MTRSQRILYQLVAPMEKSIGPQEIERRRAFLERYASPGFKIEVRSIRRGTASIESAYDAAIATPGILDSIREAALDGQDGIIVGCFGDPAVDAAREIVRVPVVAAGMSAMHLALQLGQQFSIISSFDNESGRTKAYIRQLGLGERCASTRGIGLSVVELARGDKTALDRIVEIGRRCITEDGADVLVLGCMSMAFLGLTTELQQRLGIPVVSPVIAALKTLEMMLSHGVSHSLAAWPPPPEKPILDRGF